MIFELLKLNIDITDDDFNSIYPDKVKKLSRKHWTSVAVAKAASQFLVHRPGAKVLDIGSGPGKFCLVGASNTKGHFTGVEQRIELIKLAKRLSESYLVRNVNFIHANITSINFSDYDAFYFFNSFHENIDRLNKIDCMVPLNAQLYNFYSMYIVEQFASLPLGARLATYCSPLNIVPSSFRLIDSSHGGTLKFWEKVCVPKDPAICEN